MNRLTKTIVGILLLTLLFGCSKPVSKQQEGITFTQTYTRVQDVDTQFGTNFRSESLRHEMVSQETAMKLLSELFVLREEVLDSSSRDKRDSFDLVQARIMMVESQLAYLKAESFTTANYTRGLNCSQADSIQSAIISYATSLERANGAVNLVDELIQNPAYRLLLGVDNTSIAFYGSDVKYVSKRIETGKEFIRKSCGMIVV